MAEDRISRRGRFLDKARAEIGRLEEAGVRMAGNAFSPVLVAKGELDAEELAGAELCSGKDGVALRAALGALGYAPEDWCALATVDAEGRPLDASLMRLAVTTMGPLTVVLCDEGAAACFRDAYMEELACLGSIDAAMLLPGYVALVLGMRVMNLGGFEAALADERAKQLMWARLKQLPPLGEPY